MSCEPFEVEISALVDGELEPDRVLPVVDHVAGCPDCRRFFLDARRLDAVVAPTRDTAPAPVELWPGIAAAGGLARRPPWALPRWALAAAAMAFGALGLWTVLSVAGAAPGTSRIETALSGRPGAMSERRFVQLTVELLEAGPRYRRAMLEVLREIAAESAAEDGSADVWVGGDERERRDPLAGEPERADPSIPRRSGTEPGARL